MVKVRKFAGYLADQANAHNIIAPPYDVLNTEEARKMAAGNEMSFLHCNKPEIDLPEVTNLYDPLVYKMGHDNLESFKHKGWLRQDEEARMYVYMQRMGERKQYGILALASVEDYENGIIKRHEYTIKKKEEDRTKLTDIQNANTGPIFLTFKDGEDIEKRMMEVVHSTEPYSAVTCDDGVEHVLWKCSVEDSDYFVTEFGKIPVTYIADGHHRTASAYNVGKARREAAKARGEQVTGEEGFNFFMAIHYPETNLKIMDYNRVLRSLNGLTTEQFLERLAESYDIKPMEEGADPRPTTKFEHSLYIGNKWYTIRVKDEKIDRTNPVTMLDSQLLTNLVLTPILDIQDIRTDERIDFVGGIRGLPELVKRCNEDCVAAIAMYPVSLKELMEVADAGLIMPPKSTWFEPKPRDGFCVNCFDQQ